MRGGDKIIGVRADWIKVQFQRVYVRFYVIVVPIGAYESHKICYYGEYESAWRQRHADGAIEIAMEPGK